MPERAGRVVLFALTRQGLRDARVRTLCFAYLFLAYAYIQPVGFRDTYPTTADRLGFARGFGANAGLRLMYGRPFHLESVGGYVAWRVGGVLAVVAAAFGLLAAVRCLRAEEESGRQELVLAQPLTRRDVHLAAATTVTAGLAVLWLAEFAGLAFGHVGIGGSAMMALAATSSAAVFAGVGALTSQLAPTRRGASGLAALVLAFAFLLRALADTVDGLRGLDWLTPLGWAELFRPVTGARAVVLLLPAAAVAALVLVAARLASGRDVGTGVLRGRDEASPRSFLLGDPAAFALRSQRIGLITWLVAVTVLGFVFGIVCDSISSADVPTDVRRQLAKFGAGSILTPVGYLGFVFLFVVVAVSGYACAQVAAARREEEGQLETVLAEPVGRTRWLAGRLGVAGLAVTAVALVAGLATWLGARAAGVRVALPRLLEAGANALPTAAFFLGVAALAVALAPRAGVGLAYGLLAVTFLWQLVGTLLQPPRWVLELTPFAHVPPVPAQPFAPVSAVVLVLIGAVAAALALAVFRCRDVVGG